MDLKLAGEVAVVLGGASGIGRAIAAEFAAEGSPVAILDRNPAVQQVASEIAAQHGVRGLGIVADVTNHAALVAVAEQARQTLGRLDHVVYAAGMGSGKYGFPFWNLQPGDWPKSVEVTLMGAVHAAHAFTPELVRARRGTLLFISSIAGQIGSQTDPPYSAAKAGLINFAQCAAKDLAPYQVRVNTICPGMVRTPLNQAVWQSWCDTQPPDARIPYDQWADEKIRRVSPLGRWQEPEDIAALAVFLASHRGQNITGQTMNVDGGQVMHW
ncbi:MAG: SDR family NAD(P)-dependent oxidoreductase [Pirellulales bacterium]